MCINSGEVGGGGIPFIVFNFKKDVGNVNGLSRRDVLY